MRLTIPRLANTLARRGLGADFAGGGGGPAAVAVNSFQNFSSAAVPVALTEAILAASTVGDGAWTDNGGTGTSLATHFTVKNHTAYDYGKPVDIGGVIHTNSGTKWVEVDYDALRPMDPTYGYRSFIYTPPGPAEGKSKLLFEGFVDLGVQLLNDLTSSNNDIIQIIGNGGYLVMQCAQPVSIIRTLGLHNQGPVGGASFSPGTARIVLFFQLWYDNDNNVLIIRVFTTDFLMIGDLRGEPIHAGTGINHALVMSNYLNANSSSTNLFGGLCCTWDIATIRDPAPLSVDVVNPSLVALSDTEIRMQFTGVSGATGYRYDVATDAGFTSLVVNNAAVSNAASPVSQTVSGLTPSTTYYFRVRATGDGDVGANSVTDSVATLATPAWVYTIAPGDTTNDQDTLFGGLEFSSTFTIGADGVVTKLGVQINGAPSDPGTKLALYDNSNNLLVSGTFTALDASTPYFASVTVANTSIPAGTYRIAVIFNGGAGITLRRGNTANAAPCYGSGVYASFPRNPWSSDFSLTGPVCLGALIS